MLRLSVLVGVGFGVGGKANLLTVSPLLSSDVPVVLAPSSIRRVLEYLGYSMKLMSTRVSNEYYSSIWRIIAN